MMDEGYIKFNAHWEKREPFSDLHIQELNAYRQRVYDLGLIGAYDNGIGYGNISRRWGAEDPTFLISGSATGNFPQLTNEHYALVTRVAIDQNELWCTGPVIASSESMSHAVIYQTNPQMHAVIHAHHLEMWEELLHQVPTTDARATYGSPEMAYAIIYLMKHTDLPKTKLFVMEGHREGVFTFGKDLEEAFQVLQQAFQQVVHDTGND